MSEAASARDRLTADRSTALGPLEPMLRAWLPAQRWYAGKGRTLTRLRTISAAELLPPGTAPGLLHLLLDVDGDCYQLLLGIRPAPLPPPLAPALIGHAESGPYAGSAIYEGLGDPRLASLLLERLRSPGSLGPLRFDRDPGTLIPPAPAPRQLSGEQTNSSLIYGDSYILKVFRRVGPGVNPDLELPRALAAAGCTRVPAPPTAGSSPCAASPTAASSPPRRTPWAGPPPRCTAPWPPPCPPSPWAPSRRPGSPPG
jgi:maltokinase